MSKAISRDARTGKFVVGRASGEKISAVEGLTRNVRTGRLLAESDKHGETTEQLRARVRAEFTSKR